MPTIITFTPLQEPHRMRISGTGRSVAHECRDANGHSHRQRLALGSVGGVFHLDALCLHCGAHFVWDDNAEAPAATG